MVLPSYFCGSKKLITIVGFNFSPIMQDLRRRKQKENKLKETAVKDAKKEIDRADIVAEVAVKADGTLWKIMYILFGLAVAGFLGYRYATFIKLLHENDMWFSEISVS